MVHVSAMLLESEFVFESIARIDRLLSESGNAIHSVRQKDPVPMNGGRGRQLISNVDADAVSFDGFDSGAVDLAVEPPAIGDKAGRKLMIGDFLGDEVIDFHAIDDFPGKGSAAGCNDRIIVLARLAGRQVLRQGGLVGLNRGIAAIGGVRPGLLHLSIEFVKDGGTACNRRRARDETSATNILGWLHDVLMFMFVSSYRLGCLGGEGG